MNMARAPDLKKETHENTTKDETENALCYSGVQSKHFTFQKNFCPVLSSVLSGCNLEWDEF